MEAGIPLNMGNLSQSNEIHHKAATQKRPFPFPPGIDDHDPTIVGIGGPWNEPPHISRAPQLTWGLEAHRQQSPPKFCLAENFMLAVSGRLVPHHHQTSQHILYIRRNVDRNRGSAHCGTCDYDQASWDATEWCALQTLAVRNPSANQTCVGKQWHAPKKAFRPAAGLKSFKQKQKEREDRARIKAKEKEMKDEKEAERQVRPPTRLQGCLRECSTDKCERRG